MINNTEMNTELYQIIYISEATPDISYSDLENILFSAKNNNTHMGLTGMLVLRDGFFIQVIEGKKSDVKALMGKIITDRRHKMMRILGEWSIENRFFPNWTMSFIDADLVSNFHPFMQKLVDYALTKDLPNQSEFQKFYVDFMKASPIVKV